MPSDSLRQLAAAQIWGMERLHLQALMRAAEEFDLAGSVEALTAMQQDDEGLGYRVHDGTAMIPIEGTIVKTVPWLWQACGCAACGTTALMQTLDRALRDKAVERILLYVESPGGTIAGVQEASDAIYSSRGVKPIHAYIADLGASAAYWLAAQAETIACNLTAHVGSIGVYTWIEDTSRASGNDGVDVHLVASGPDKGTGLEGTHITDAQLATVRENVMAIHDIFVAAVARGRGISRAAASELATGRTWIGPKALENRLVDHVENIGETLERIKK